MASVLETFYLLFESDASKLDKGVKDSDREAKKLIDTMGKADQAASKLGQNFVTMIKSAGAAIVAGASIAAVKGMVSATAEQTDAIARSARAARIGVEDYSAWTGAVAAAGGRAESFGATIENLGRRTRTPVNALLRLSRAFKGVSDQRAARMAGMLGIDAGMIPILQKGEESIKALLLKQKELGVVTAHQAQVARGYKLQLADTNRVYDDIRRQLVTNILPYVTAFHAGMEKLGRWMRDNSELVSGFFVGIAAMVTAVYLPAMVRAIIATGAFLAPWLLIGAAVAAAGVTFSLVLDDVRAFLAGNDSVIGELSKKWPALGATIHELTAIFDGVANAFKVGARFISDAFEMGPSKAWAKFKDSVNVGIDKLAERVPWFGEVVRALMVPIKAVGDFFNDNWQAISNIIETVWEVFKSFLDGVGSGLQFLAELITKGPMQALRNLGANVMRILGELGDKFPWLRDMVNAVKGPIVAVADGIGAAWESVIDIVSGVIEFVMDAVDRVKSAIATVKGVFSKDAGRVEIEVKRQANIEWDTAEQPPAPPSRAVAARGEGVSPSRAVPARGEDVPASRAGLIQWVEGPNQGPPARLPVAPREASKADAKTDAVSRIAAAATSGQAGLRDTSNPINAMTSSSISNSVSNASRTTTVQIGEVNVETASTEPAAVGAALSDSLGDQIRGAINQYDDGVIA